MIIRRGKLNSLFIVIARMDFQIFSKNFRFHIQYSKHMALWAPPTDRAKLEGGASAISRFEHSFPALSTDLKSEKWLPACMQNWNLCDDKLWIIFSLSRLKIEWKTLGIQNYHQWQLDKVNKLCSYSYKYVISWQWGSWLARPLMKIRGQLCTRSQ